MMRTPEHIGLLGFGEVGQTLAAEFAHAGTGQLRAFDIGFDDPASVPARAAAAQPGVAAVASAAELGRASELVFSAVTADQALPALRALLPALRPGSVIVDVNSVAPATRDQAFAAAAAAGVRYVEAAVMSAILPTALAAPILLGGPHAAAILPALQALGFSGARCYATRIGPASATKLCRSVLVKGIEALAGEALVTARHYGVETAVLESLANVAPPGDLDQQAMYLIQRSVTHGRRRAEEMRAAAATVRAAGLAPLMCEATAARQEWAAGFGPALDTPADSDTLAELLDRIIAITRTDQDPAADDY